MIYAKGPRLQSKLSSFYRRCRCYTCLAHPNHAAVLRRPTTTAASSSLLFSPALTVAFYSTVILYGAMWDSRRKQNRRQSLDNAILEAEHEISATHKRHASRLAALGMEAEDVPDFASDASPSEGQFQLTEQRAEEATGRAPFRLRHQRTLSRLQDSAGALPDGVIQTSADLPSSLRGLGNSVIELLATNQTKISEHALTKQPNSIYADEEARATTKFTPKKLLTTEYSVARMASYLLRSVTPRGTREREELSEAAMHLTEQLDVLAGEDAMWTQSVSRLAHPQFTPDIDGAEEMAEQLNGAIMSLAVTRLRRRISRRRFARLLAYSFLNCPVAPDKATYANLIKHLSRLREYGMADIVLACVDKCCVRYDELLIDTILVHYIRANRPSAFTHFHERMCGEHGGLMLAKSPHVTELHAPPPWKLNLSKAGKYAAYVPLDAKIWETLISGYLSFGLPGMANDLYEIMIDRGFTPGLRILTQLMRRAMKASDHSRTLVYWQKAEEECMEPSNGRIAHGSAEHHCIRTALQFCKQAGKPHMFQNIYRKALERGLWMHTLLPRVMVRHLASDTTYSAALRRQVHVLEQRAAMYAEDFARFSLFGFASEMLLKGKPLAFIQNTFIKMSETAALEEWTQERRSYGQHERTWQLIKREWRTFKDRGRLRGQQPTPKKQHPTPAERSIVPQTTLGAAEERAKLYARAKPPPEPLPKPANADARLPKVRIRRMSSRRVWEDIPRNGSMVAAA